MECNGIEGRNAMPSTSRFPRSHQNSAPRLPPPARTNNQMIAMMTLIVE
jgi:hypothetical protein